MIPIRTRINYQSISLHGLLLVVLVHLLKTSGEQLGQECVKGQSEVGECLAMTETLEDRLSDCPFFAERGECNINPIYMLEHCIQSCLDDGELGTIGYFEEKMPVPYETNDGGACEDVWDEKDPEEREDNRSCDELIENGHCWMLPDLMMERCPLSCLYCFEKE